jgi:hypothetical protein
LRITTLLWFSGGAAAFLVYLALVGWAARLLVRRVVPSFGTGVPLSVLGLSVVAVPAWYALDAGWTLSTWFYVITALAGLVLIVAWFGWIRRTRKGRGWARELRGGRAALMAWPGVWLGPATLALVMVVSLFTLGLIYANGRHVVASLGNADMANYAIYAQQLIRGGFHSPGNVVGANLGAGVKDLGYGAFILLGTAALALHTSVLYVIYVVMLGAMFLGSYGMVRLLVDRYHVSALLAVLAGVAPYSAFLVVYLENEYFLSEVIAMGLIPPLLTFTLEACSSMSWRAFWGAIMGTGALVATCVIVYPQFSVVLPIMFLPAAVVGSRGGRHLARAGRGVAAVVAGSLLGLVVNPAASAEGWQTALVVVRGSVWPMPAQPVSALLGLESSTSGQPSLYAWAGSALVVVVSVALGVALWRDDHYRKLSVLTWAAGVAILGSYVAVYLYEGASSYQQWKWIVLFTPILGTLLVVQGLWGLGLMVGRIGLGDARGREVAAVLAALYVMALSSLTGEVSFNASESAATLPEPGPYHASYLDLDMIGAAMDPRVQALKSLNVDVGIEWEALWFCYLLPGQRLYLLSPSYFSEVPAGASWTLEDIGSGGPQKGAIALNGTYQLVHVPG